MSSYNISMLRLALLLLPAVTTAADDDDATAAQRCGGPVFGGALDLGGHLAVVFRSVGSDWLALRGTGGFDVQHGGRWHAAPVSTAMGVNNPSGSNVINLAPVPGLSTSVAITQVRYRCHLDNSSKSCVKGEVEGCSVYASSGPGGHWNGSEIIPARSFTGNVTPSGWYATTVTQRQPDTPAMAAALAADHPVRSSVISPRPVTAPIAMNGNQNGAIWIWKGSGHDTAAMTAIGLLNRHAKRPVAYALFNNSNHPDEAWLVDTLRQGDPLLTPTPQLKNYTNSTELVLAAVAAGAVEGRVLYSSSKSELHSLPTALTFGGIHTGVVVDCAGSALAGLCAKNLESQLPTIHDCRGKWPDAQAATKYAIDHLLSKTASDDIMVFLDPGVLASGYLVDFVVSRSLFTMFPVDNGVAPGLGGICVEHSAAQELFERATRSDHWNGEAILSVMGYNTGALWWSEVESMCTPQHDILSLVSDFVTNLSFHSLLTAFDAMAHAELPPVRTDLVYNRSKTYVAIVRSDGDNIQIVTGADRSQMEKRLQLCNTASDRNRSIACPPFSWTINARLAHFAPNVLRWYYTAAAKTGQESFMMGPSGFGYNFPAAIKPPSKQALFANSTAGAAAAVGWEAYVHWDRIGPTNPGAEEQYSFEKDTAALEVYLQRLSGTAITGAFMRYPESKDLPDQIGSVSVIKAYQALDQAPPDIAAALNAAAVRGSTGFLYEIFATDLNAAWLGELKEHVELVGHRELISLHRQRLGVSSE